MKLLEKQEISCQIDLTTCHKRGLIPGPNESVDHFLKRVNRVDEVKQKTSHTLTHFGLRPDWVDIYTEQKGLPFWEGATTWIEENAQRERRCTIQLKPPRLTWLYSEEEILSHELVHAVRLMFDEPRFEEILAFQTSKNPWRRYYGPLFNRPLESWLFVISLVVAWVGYSIDLIWGEGELGNYIWGLPSVGLLWCGVRLIRSQWVFAKALKKVAAALRRPQKARKMQGIQKAGEIKEALSLMLYLTDEEIALFARTEEVDMKAYAQRQRETSLRWRLVARHLGL